MQRNVTRHFLVKGERRRNGLVIVDRKTGNEIRIKVHRGRDRDTLRLAITADDDLIVYPEEAVSP